MTGPSMESRTCAAQDMRPQDGEGLQRTPRRPAFTREPTRRRPRSARPRRTRIRSSAHRRIRVSDPHECERELRALDDGRCSSRASVRHCLVATTASTREERSASLSSGRLPVVHLDSERRNRPVASAPPQRERPAQGPAAPGVLTTGIGQSSAGRGGHQRLTRASICLSAAIALVSAAREAAGTEVS